MARKPKEAFITAYQLHEITSSTIAFDMRESRRGDSHPGLLEAHRHGFYTLVLSLEKSPSKHLFDFEPLLLEENSMLLIVPGQVHQPLGDKFGKGYLFSFTADFLAGQHVTLPLYAAGPVQLSGPALATATSIAAIMLREYKSQAPHYTIMLQHSLALLLTLLQRHLAPAAALQPGPALLLRYRELVAARFLEWTRPVQYAQALHVTADHLNEVVRQYSGQTATALITARRILEAKRLLLHAQESIKEIAWHLQFKEVSYFNRFFKQHTGTTPAAFREASRKMYTAIPE